MTGPGRGAGRPTSLPPNGSAGGDLTGTYPNPTLAAVATAGTTGDSTHVPAITIDAKGRVTAVASNAIPSDAAAGTASLRSLGTSSTTAAAGNHTAHTSLSTTATDGTGTLLLPAQTATPAAPAAGNAKLSARTRAGRDGLVITPGSGQPRSLAQVPFDRPYQDVRPQSTTSIRHMGVGTSAAATGTVSTPAVSASGFFTQLAQGSANSSANVFTNAMWFRGAANDLHAGWYFHSRIYLPDASYDNTGAGTGSKVNIGMSASGAVATNARGSGVNFACFNREHVNGSNTDTNWKLVTNDGGAGPTVVDAGLAFTPQHVYDLFLWCAAGAAAIYGRIDDLTAGTTSGDVSSNATLPAAATALMPLIDLRTINATTRNIQFARMYVEGEKG